MKKVLNRIISGLLVVSGILFIASLNSCKKEHLTLTTTSDVNMYSYLDNNADQFSLFKQIIDKAGFASFLNTYGTYTLFATNNAGVNAYLKAAGKANVDAIDVATAKNIVSISLIADTINTQLFTDGKMRTPTTSGQYLITSATNTAGVSTTVINKQANLVQGNIKTGNGLIHIVDNILLPATLTLAQTVEQNPKYTIFTAILKATGFYDTLNVAANVNTNTNRKFVTLIAQTDDVFKAAGFADYNAVKARYSTKGDPKNHADSLWLYTAYRVFPELSYLSDIVASASHPTLAPLEVSTSELVGTSVLLNNDTFNGILEPGIPLDRPVSDVTATNGVLHSATKNYTIKIRFPSPVYFDVADQPEIKRTPGLYRGVSKAVPFYPGQIAGIALEGNNSVNNNVTYSTEPAIPNSGDYYFNNDWLLIGLRFRTGANASNVSKVTFKTPVIVRGRYKIWVDYKRISNNQNIPVAFDGVTLPNVLNVLDPLNGNETDAQAESRGYKSYSDSPVTTNLGSAYNGHVGRLVGIVDVATTDRHSISFTATAPSNGGGQLILDVIEFRPIDMNQIRPRLGRAGNLVP